MELVDTLKQQLLKELICLGNEVTDATLEFKEKNSDKIQATQCEFRPVINLEYHHDGVGYSLDRPNFKQYVFHEWKSSTDLVEFADHFVTKKSFEDALENLSELMAPHHIIKNEKERKEFLKVHVLRQFVLYIAKQAIRDNFDRSRIDATAENLISDVTVDSTIYFKAKIFLKNIWIDRDCIEIYKDVRLRRMGVEELNEYTTNLYESEMDRLTGRMRWVNCFLEIDVAEKNGLNLKFDVIKKRIRNYAHCFISVLRLYKIADVHEESVLYFTDSVMHYTFDENVPTPYSAYMDSGFLPKDGTNFYEKFTSADVPKIHQAFNILKPIVSKIGKASYFEGEPHEIAFHRYMDSLLRSQLHINRISYCLYSLDAMLVLYTEQKKQDRITHRTALIVSIVLKQKIDGIKEKLLEAYQIRSLLVHGGKMDIKQKEFAQTQTKEIINYTRITLAAFLQISTKMKKEEFIEILKAADNKKGIKVLTELLQSIHIPNI